MGLLLSQRAPATLDLAEDAISSTKHIFPSTRRCYILGPDAVALNAGTRESVYISHSTRAHVPLCSRKDESTRWQYIMLNARYPIPILLLLLYNSKAYIS